MSWEDILKEDRSNWNVWIEYETFDGVMHNLGPVKYPEFDKILDEVPTQAARINIILKKFTKDGKYLGTEVLEQPSTYRHRQ